MRLLDENYQEIREQDIDLTRGYVYGATIIRPDAQSHGKTVWANEDYERVRIFRPYTREELEAAGLAAPRAPRNITAGEYITLHSRLYLATANIPRGELLVVGQNAVETTLEAQLAELMKGE